MNIIKVLKLILLFLLITTNLFSIENKTIKIAAAEYEPYISKNTKSNSYVPFLLKKIYEEAGYKLDIKYYPLKRALIMCETGEVDIAIPLYSDNGLLENVKYSDPFPGGFTVLFKRKDLNVDLNNLGKYSVGLRGESIDKEIMNISEFKKIFFTNTDNQTLTMLDNKRFEFMVIDKYTASFIMNNQLPHLIGEFEYIKESVKKKDFYLAFSTKNSQYSEILDIFNTNLRIFKQNGYLNEIVEKYGFYDMIDVPKENSSKTELTIATVNNQDMMIMKELSRFYEAENPEIKLNWQIMDETILRDRITSDLSINDGRFDIITLGAVETPSWAQRNWITKLGNIPSEYNLDDIIPPVKQSISYNNNIYALPFYAEGIMIYYRKDLFENAGLVMPLEPSWEDIEYFASKLHNPEKGIYGITLRGDSNWHEMLSIITAMLHNFGGEWFDKNFKPQLNSKIWFEMITYYTNLLKKYGPEDSYKNGYLENLNIFKNGNAAIWIDATVGASLLNDQNNSKVKGNVGYVSFPKGYTNGNNWLWVWSLAIPVSSSHKEEANKFILWATSQEYIKLVGNNYGWLLAPPGTRSSTYSNPEYQKKAPFSDFVLESIEKTNIYKRDNKSYYGLQYVDIPEYPTIGNLVSHEIVKVLKDEQSVEQALINSQKIVYEIMRKAGYF